MIPGCPSCVGAIVFPDARQHFVCTLCDSDLGLCPPHVYAALMAPPPTPLARPRPMPMSQSQSQQRPPGCCPDCGSADSVEDARAGDRVCCSCGLVLEAHVMSDRPEWRDWADDEAPSRARVGAPAAKACAWSAPASAAPQELRIAPGAGSLSRDLVRASCRAGAHPVDGCELREDLDRMCGAMAAGLACTPSMCALAAQMYRDYRELPAARARGAACRQATMAACAYLGSAGAANEPGARRDLEEVCLALGVADLNAARGACTRVRDGLGEAGVAYADVLRHAAGHRDMLKRMLRSLPPEIVPDGAVWPAFRLASWICDAIGEQAAGDADTACFAKAVAITAAAALLGAQAEQRAALAERLRISLGTLQKHERTIMAAVGARRGLAVFAQEVRSARDRLAHGAPARPPRRSAP